MKIIQLIQRPQLRGAEVFACLLSSKLVDMGHEVIVVSIFDGAIDLPFDGRIETIGGAQHSKFTDWEAWKRLAALISKERPDLIQANAGDTLKYAVLSKLFFRWDYPIVFRNAGPPASSNAPESTSR
jgi:hypothetical protein